MFKKNNNNLILNNLYHINGLGKKILSQFKYIYIIYDYLYK